MTKSTIENMAEPIGFEIGTSDDNIQGKLLNGFCKGLHNSIPQKSNLEMQLCYIADKLDNRSDEIILALADFIKLKNK